MKYLLILVLFVIGCTSEKQEEAQLIPGIGRMHECNNLLQLGYKIDRDACVKHIDHPKFKISDVKSLTSTEYSDKCRFQIYRPIWSHGYVLNKPAYAGRLSCPDPNGKFVEFVKDTVLESDLK